MRPAKFVYQKAVSVSDASDKLGISTGLVKPIAGGQSLVPMMNLRLARPNTLVSVRCLPDLREMMETSTAIKIGAAVTHSEIEDSEPTDKAKGYLSYVAKGIGYRAIRNRGTIGGALCHADPAADWTTSLSAIGARCHIHGANGKRQIPVEEIMIAPFVTCLEPSEILVSIDIPKLSHQAKWAYVKFCHKAGEFAKSICAIVLDPEQGRSRIFIGSTDGPPLFLRQTSLELKEGNLKNLLKIAHGEIHSSLPSAGPDQLAFHNTMVERALARLEVFS